MIELKDFSIGYKNKKELLKDVNVEIPGKSLTALVGRNGTGKSTLLRALTGVNSDYSGSIIIDGQNLSAISPVEKARLVSYVSTRMTRISNLKCRDIIAMGRAPYTNWIGRMSAEDIEIVEMALKITGMEKFADRTLDTMSDGETQRIMIARALAQSTPVILLDEPTSFLDLPARYELVDTLKQLTMNEGKTILFSTHELDIAMKLTDNVAILADNNLTCLSSDAEYTETLINRKFGVKKFIY